MDSTTDDGFGNTLTPHKETNEMEPKKMTERELLMKYGVDVHIGDKAVYGVKAVYAKVNDFEDVYPKALYPNLYPKLEAENAKLEAENAKLKAFIAELREASKELREALKEVIEQTDGRNHSILSRDRAYAIALAAIGKEKGIV